MQRRQFVRVMAAMGLAPRLLAQSTGNPAPPPPAPVPWTLGLNPATPLPRTVVADAVAEGQGSFFSATQMATLNRLSVLLVPPMDGRPGAMDAGAPAFLDFLIGSSPAPRQDLYRTGLDHLDAASRQQFQVPFAQTETAQADALVKPWMRTWMTDHPPTEPHAAFLNIAHADIRTATLNSEAWTKSEGKDDADGESASALFWSPIDPDVYNEDDNRVHVRPSPTVAAPRSSHTVPSYPN